ncbi:MAG: ABC transporter permease [Gammaproteobacteria bacterium]|nr:ABC transporter permease [Gammaproteobacteria bacterium]
MNSVRNDAKRLLIYTISPAVLFVVWEICARAGFLDVRFFPAPSTIFYHLFFVSPEEGIVTDVIFSVYRIFAGYFAGCALGMMLGIGMGLSHLLRMAFYPLIIVTYPIPKIAILPLIMLIFGIGDLSKIVVVAIGSFFLVLMNTLHGVDSLAKIYYDVAAVYRISRRNFIFRIVIPGSLPSIFTGLKLAIGYSLVIVVAAEFSGADKGIGYLIWQSWETFSINSMYAGIFVIGVLGFIFSYTLDLLERRLVPWKDKK